MSSIYDVFQLLPPPPRIALSTVPESERGRLPNFLADDDPAAALKLWARHIFYPNIDSTWIHVYITTAFLSALMIIIVVLIAGRLWEKTAWLLRIVRKPNGILLVPNSMLAFTGAAGIFGITLLSWYWTQWRWFKQDHSPTTTWLWNLMIWCPMFTAAHLATWGLYHSLPNTFSSSVDPNSDSLLRRIVFRPFVLNFLGLALPFLQAGSIAIPAAMCHHKFSNALTLYAAWRDKYASQTELSQEMLVEAQQFRYAVYDVFKLASVTFFLWTAWGFLILVAYSATSWKLIRVLRKQLLLLRKRAERNGQGIMSEFGPNHYVPNSGMLSTGGASTGEPWMSSKRSSVGDALSPSTLVNPLSPRNKDDGNLKSMDSGSEDVQESFFPRFRPSKIVQKQAPRMSSKNSSVQNKSYLEGIYWHVVIQAVGIVPTILAFTGLAAYLAVLIPTVVESQDVGWNEYLKTAILVSGYSVSFAGSVTLLQIAKRQYEPMLHFRGLSGEGSGSASKKLRKRQGRPISRVGLGGTSNGDLGHGAFTSFFETETIQRPASSFSNARTLAGPYHEMSDLERGSGRATGLGINRRFSQGIVEVEEDETLDDGSCTSSKPFFERNLKIASNRELPLPSPTASPSGFFMQRTITTVSNEDPDVARRSHTPKPVRKAVPTLSRAEVMEEDLISSGDEAEGQRYTPRLPRSSSLHSRRSSATSSSPRTALPPPPRPRRSASRKSPARSSPPSQPYQNRAYLAGLGQPNWQAPPTWDSGEPDAELIREDAQRRQALRNMPRAI